jgi:hypothetical protein
MIIDSGTNLCPVGTSSKLCVQIVYFLRTVRVMKGIVNGFVGV